MTREAYTRRLDALLRKLPQSKRWGIVEDINMHFIDGASAGKSDDELAEGLGTPEALARAYTMGFAAERVREKSSVGNVFRMMWAALGMGLLNVMLALPMWLAIAALWIGLLAAGLSAVAGGLFSSVVALIDWFWPLTFANGPLHVPLRLPVISGGVAAASLGGLLTIGSIYLGKWLLKLMARYLQANRTIIIKRH